jgi:hydrogenase/urease accessory protein HupE
MLFTSKKLLLFDGFGAMLSALLLGMVLVRWQHLIGMPVQVLHILAAVAGLFSCYSFTSYFMTNDNWRSYLKGIAWANILYCFATIGLLLHFWSVMTIGWYLLLHCRDHCGLFPRDN